jgi:RND family efflux transporter MFP subunit
MNAPLRIDPAQRRRPANTFWPIIAFVVLVTGAAVYFAWPRARDSQRVFGSDGKAQSSSTTTLTAPATPSPAAAPVAPAAAKPGDSVLTASGYIINRERIELSPRMMGAVTWIGVKKGDLVKKDEVVVRLDDAEQRARLLEIEGQLAGAKVARERAQIAYDRVKRLRSTQIETQEREDEARLAVAAADATIQQMTGMREMAQVQLDWTVIRSPIDGVILEKIAKPGELVTPQSFGGPRGPSTSLLALADPNDLQVEIDVNESDLAKITLGQPCRVTPEAFADKHYYGTVAEIAPEANRQKGTLQIKVQIANPDRYLTPELSARVDFLTTAKNGALKTAN